MIKKPNNAQARALRQIVSRASEAYKRSLIGYQAGLAWDYVVLTAANEHQAAGYRHELALRTSGNGPMGAFFPASQQTLVVADPPGFRIGSGGATFYVLRQILKRQKALGDKRGFDSLRVLLIHSGGASQRIPQFSPLGKIFMPLPMVRPDGQLMTIFDHLYLMTAPLPPKLGAGMLVAAGDVFLLFDGGAIPSQPSGITALGIRAPAILGQGHGVFIPSVSGNKMAQVTKVSFPLVAGTLQKASVAELSQAGAVDARGNVLIDSGLVHFDAAATSKLSNLGAVYTPAWNRRHRRSIDLYADIIPAARLGASPPDTHEPGAVLIRDMQRAFESTPLCCHELARSHFQHLGTTRQFRDAVTGRDHSPICSLFQQNVRLAADVIKTKARVYQSVIAAATSHIGRDSVVENCLINSPIMIGAGAMLSNVTVDATSVLRVPENTLVYGAALRVARQRGTVIVVCGVNDDPKTDHSLCNLSLKQWLKLARVKPRDLWPAGEKKRNLWTARLYPMWGANEDWSDILWLARPQTATAAQRTAWRKARRYSMGEVLALVDAAAMAEHRDTIAGRLEAMQWLQSVKANTASSVQGAIAHFGVRGYGQLVQAIAAEAANNDLNPLTRARLNWSLAEIVSRPLFPRGAAGKIKPILLRQQAFAAVRDAVNSSASFAKNNAQAASLQHLPHRVKALAPVRLDLAGGWSDTPPYCLEEGGAVVNVAIDLNDVEPIESSLTPLDEPVVRLISRDLGRMLVIRSPEQLRTAINTQDVFGLHRAALQLCGLLPLPNETSQRRWLNRVSPNGGGFELATASNLPKGSGMGTSSILGATTLAVLRSATGQRNDPEELFEQTLQLEQVLGAGGGWQDQVGGIIGGVKLITTRPGLVQRLQVKRVPINPRQLQDLQDRLVVYFTGRQRLARNILREVMGRYLSREPGALVLFNELKQSAMACAAALEHADWLSCASEINRYWRIKKDLFAGSTTPAIDALFLELRPYYLAACLSGAGGGGFAFFLCSGSDQAHRLRTELSRISLRPGSLGLAFAVRVNTVGLRVGS